MLLSLADFAAVEGNEKTDRQTGPQTWDSSSHKVKQLFAIESTTASMLIFSHTHQKKIDEDMDKNNYVEEKDKVAMRKLHDKLDAAIVPFVESSGGAFVKLSTRRYLFSPQPHLCLWHNSCTPLPPQSRYHATQLNTSPTSHPLSTPDTIYILR